MGLRCNYDTCAAMLLAGAAAIDAGPGTSLLQIWSGTKPANIGDAVTTQKKLVEFSLPAVTFPTSGAAPVTGGASIPADTASIPSTPATSDASTGTLATWGRVIDGNGVVVYDGEVTDTNGAGPIKLANTTLIQNIDVTVVTWTMFHPDGSV